MYKIPRLRALAQLVDGLKLNYKIKGHVFDLQDRHFLTLINHVQKNSLPSPIQIQSLNEPRQTVSRQHKNGKSGPR